MDPRYQILSFFNQIAQQGEAACGEKKEDDFLSRRPLLWYLPNRASVFTVWRPTSLDAIRRMMCGEAVGKGLDIKGKSAKVSFLFTFAGHLVFLSNTSIQFAFFSEASSPPLFRFCKYPTTSTKSRFEL